MNVKQKAQLIRKAVREAGYDYVESFNNKLKDHNRLKCTLFGQKFSKEQYDLWLTKINEKLKEYKVEVISSNFEEVEWYGYSGHYAYIARFN